MTWREYSMAGFDLETTGVDPESDQVVAASIGLVAQRGAWEPKNWLLRQSQPIPEGATAVHGITTERVNMEGVDHKSGLAQIRDALYRAWGLGAIAATRLAWKLANGPNLPQGGDGRALNRWHADAYRQQRISFASYLRRQGKDREADEIEARTTWPIEPMRRGA